MDVHVRSLRGRVCEGVSNLPNNPSKVLMQVGEALIMYPLQINYLLLDSTHVTLQCDCAVFYVQVQMTLDISQLRHHAWELEGTCRIRQHRGHCNTSRHSSVLPHTFSTSSASTGPLGRPVMTRSADMIPRKSGSTARMSMTNSSKSRCERSSRVGANISNISKDFADAASAMSCCLALYEACSTR